MAESVSILGIPVDLLSYEQVLGRIDPLIDSDRQGFVATLNPEMVLAAQRDPLFATILRSATMRTPDGVGILWASNYLAKPRSRYLALRWLGWFVSLVRVPFVSFRPWERVTGTDLLERIAGRSASKGWSLFLLGAEPGVADAAAEALTLRHPGCRIVGCFAGSPRVSDEAVILEKINRARPDLLFVAYGCPAQEQWIHRNLLRLPSVKLAIGVGGAFDFFAGKRKRAPSVLRKIGLEWLWRLLIQPGRIRRIWNAAILFPFKVLISDEHFT
jgi:N-acetylglucosaminyldiphosphoundecaprenol N-acetyl-beta-D-mannosaminyltransferase